MRCSKPSKSTNADGDGRRVLRRAGALLAPTGRSGALAAQVVDELGAGTVGMRVQRSTHAEGVAVPAGGLQVAGRDEVVGVNGLGSGLDWGGTGARQHGHEEEGESSDELHCDSTLGMDWGQVDSSKKLGWDLLCRG